jgi:hypothetical protein
MRHWIARHQQALLGAATAISSIAAWVIFASLNVTTVYNDAMSHLNVARLVVDNIQPGFAQLGSVWLPMNHILSLVFVWNDPLWHTGLAGSLISMISFVISTIAIYKLTTYISGSKWGGVGAAAVFCFTINMLYLQATPLTEPLYLCLFILTTLFIVRYVGTRSDSALIAASLVSAVGVLTRYDAWFVAGVAGAIIFASDLFFEKQTLKSTIGRLIVFAFPVFFAALLWFGWNLLIFHDPLYAFTGPYSAHAQQALIESSSGLITKHNVGVSVWAYLLSIFENVGIAVALVGSAGWIVGLFMRPHTMKTKVTVVAGVLLLSIIVFNILALFLGFSILNLPALHWNPSGTLAGSLFNVRYGILALPFVAVGLGLIVACVPFKKQWLAASAVVILVVCQSVYFCVNGIITIQDGIKGSSAFVNQDIAAQLKQKVGPNDTVIMSTSSYNAVAFVSGLELRQFIHEGVSREWNGAISEPDKYAKWIVAANNDVGEPVHESLIKNHNSAFLQKYKLIFKGAYAGLYERK